MPRAGYTGSHRLLHLPIPTTVGFVIGFLSNRFRGPSFVLAPIAFSEVLLIVGSRWRGFPLSPTG